MLIHVEMELHPQVLWLWPVKYLSLIDHDWSIDMQHGYYQAEQCNPYNPYSLDFLL
jgi:hypothetical protein